MFFSFKFRLESSRNVSSEIQKNSFEVEYLDRYIIGQGDAKKAVANALRMRWRRQQLSPELREDIMPKNILMVENNFDKQNHKFLNPKP